MRNICESPATSVVENARRRVRSSGMMRPKYDETKSYNPIMYCTNTRQYLEQRNKTFAQNSFHYTRTGLPSLITTPDPTDQINRYSPGGLLHCPKLYISSADTNEGFMQYIWIEKLTNVSTDHFDTNKDNHKPNTNEINFETGYYTIEDVNATIHSAMVSNKHYFISKANGSKVFLMNLIYNVYEQKIELQCLSSAQFPASEYSIPTGATWSRPDIAIDQNIPPTTNEACPVLFVPNNNMSTNIGFAPGYYPNVSQWLYDTTYNPASANWDNNNTSTEIPYYPVYNGVTCPNVRNTYYATLSTQTFHVFPLYKSVDYHPNNTRFAQQGAVSASQRTLRQKYDQITSNGSTYITPYNSATANALAYSTRSSSYSKKDMLGYPNKKSTVLCPNTGEMKCVDILRTKRNLP